MNLQQMWHSQEVCFLIDRLVNTARGEKNHLDTKFVGLDIGINS